MLQSWRTTKCQSIGNIHGEIELYYSEPLQNPNFMALAVIVLKKKSLSWKLDRKLSSQVTWKCRSILFIDDGVDLHSKRCMYDPNFMAITHIVFEKQDEIRKFDEHLQSRWTVKNKAKTVDDWVDLYSSSCMYDQSFIALALIISVKMTNAKTWQKFAQSVTFTLQDICMT